MQRCNLNAELCFLPVRAEVFWLREGGMGEYVPYLMVWLALL